ITLATVSGGDLVITQDGDLWIINRIDDVFVNLTDGTSSFEPGLGEINGAALLEDGTIIVSNAGSTELNLIDPATGMLLDLAFPIDFELRNGDMASGCIGGFTFETECEDFRYFYIADNTSGFAQGTVFEGELSGGEFVLTQLFEAGISAHLAVNTENGLFFVVNGNVLRTYSYSGLLINEVSTSAIGGVTAAVYNSNDGLVYVGDAPGNEIWAVDPVTGDQTLFADDVPVQGGDLFFSEEGGLYLFERINNGSSRVYEIVLGEAVLVSDIVNSVNGGARTLENGFIVAEGNNSNSFFTYDLDGGNETELTAILDGELFPVVDGDMASGCFDNVDFVEPQMSSEVVSEIGKIATYPNPSVGDSNVKFEVLEDGFTSIELIDITGTVQQVVFSQKAYAGEQYNIQINATDIPDGIYIYKLTTNKGVVSTKLMINRD
ncbi:MAG: T9SS type A sorting domain-containing protein, partial [Bacteroidota bacterium]